MEDKYSNLCILLAGGKGIRLGGNIPKQYIEVAGRTILEHTLIAIRMWDEMDGLLIVADDEWDELITETVARVFDACGKKVRYLGRVMPGSERQGSILNALRYARASMLDKSVVMIHDSVRPIIDKELISRCYKKMADNDAVTPGLNVKETIYVSSDGEHLTGNLSRDSLYVGQTPEFFDFFKYLKANEGLSEEKFAQVRGSAQPAIMVGLKVAVVRGDERNIKITTPGDLDLFKRYVTQKHED